jgi:hypothetical protein
MAFTERNALFIGICDDGQIEFRQTRVITDGADVFEKHHRQALAPGQDVTTFPAKLRNICAVVWTPAVIAAYSAAKAAREAALTP